MGFSFLKGKLTIVEGSRVGVRGEKRQPAGGHKENGVGFLSGQ